MDQQIREVAEKYLAEKVLAIGKAITWNDDLPRAKAVRYEISRSEIFKEDGDDWFTVVLEGNYFLESEDGSETKHDQFLVNVAVSKDKNAHWIATGDFE